MNYAPYLQVGTLGGVGLGAMTYPSWISQTCVNCSASTLTRWKRDVAFQMGFYDLWRGLAKSLRETPNPPNDPVGQARLQRYDSYAALKAPLPDDPFWKATPERAADYADIATRAEAHGGFHTNTSFTPGAAINDVLQKIPVVGAPMKIVADTFSAPFDIMSNIVSGERLDHVALGALKDQLKTVKEAAPYAQTIVSLVPGVGTGVAAAIGAGAALAEGQNITEAIKAGVLGALPGGPLAAAAFNTALKVASGKNVAISALESARGLIPAGPAQTAFDIGISVATGAKIQATAAAAGTPVSTAVPAQTAPRTMDPPKRPAAPTAARTLDPPKRTPAPPQKTTAPASPTSAVAPGGFRYAPYPKMGALNDAPGASSEVRSPTSTSTEVRSPTSTSTEVRSPTSTSTEAYTQGNFTVTVTGGAGAGATNVNIEPPPLNRENTARSRGAPKNAHENVNINAPRPSGPTAQENKSVNASGLGGPGFAYTPYPKMGALSGPPPDCISLGPPIADMSSGMRHAGLSAVNGSRGRSRMVAGPDGKDYLFALENGNLTARQCFSGGALSGPGFTYAPYALNAPPHGSHGGSHGSHGGSHYFSHGGGRGGWGGGPWNYVTTVQACRTWGNPIMMISEMATAAQAALNASGGRPTTVRGPDGVLYLFAIENGAYTARTCAAV